MDKNRTTLPLENNVASKHTKKNMELLKLETSKWLCEDVRYHIVGGAIEEADMALRDSLTDKTEVDIDVFCSTMESGIL